MIYLMDIPNTGKINVFQSKYAHVNTYPLLFFINQFMVGMFENKPSDLEIRIKNNWNVIIIIILIFINIRFNNSIN